MRRRSRNTPIPVSMEHNVMVGVTDLLIVPTVLAIRVFVQMDALTVPVQRCAVMNITRMKINCVI